MADSMWNLPFIWRLLAGPNRIERAICFYITMVYSAINENSSFVWQYFFFLPFSILSNLLLNLAAAARWRHPDTCRYVCDTAEAAFTSSSLHVVDDPIASKKPWFPSLPRTSFFSLSSIFFFAALHASPYIVTISGIWSLRLSKFSRFIKLCLSLPGRPQPLHFYMHRRYTWEYFINLLQLAGMMSTSLCRRTTELTEMYMNGLALVYKPSTWRQSMVKKVSQHPCSTGNRKNAMKAIRKKLRQQQTYSSLTSATARKGRKTHYT